MKKRKIEISSLTILKIVAILIGLWLLWKIFDIILILFVVVIITATLSPTVDWLAAKRVPRILAVTLIYILALAILGGAAYLIIPPFVEQIKELTIDLPQILAKISPSLSSIREQYLEQPSFVAILHRSLETLSGQLTQISINIFSTAWGFFSGLIITLAILVLTFYLLLEKDSLKNLLESILPKEKKENAFAVLRQVRVKWGAWVRGRLLLSVIVGLIVYIGLVIFGFPFALALAILAGLLDIIPYIGPTIAAVPAIIIAFFISPWLGLAVLIFYIVVNLFENVVLVPKIMQKAVGLSPVTIIVALLIGAKLAGILGIILAIPAAAGIVVLFTEWKRITKQEDEKKA